SGIVTYEVMISALTHEMNDQEMDMNSQLQPKCRRERRNSIHLPPHFALNTKHMLECPVCLDGLMDPVTTPCGHNFCKSCLKECWDRSQDYRCPLCKDSFGKIPEVKTNTVLREIVLIFERKLAEPLSINGPLSQELECSICLDVFAEPVTSPCGHSFCKSCLEICWRSSLICSCPFCKETFQTRPDLKCNITLKEFVQLLQENTGYKREPAMADFLKAVGERTNENLSLTDSVCCAHTGNPKPSVNHVKIPCGDSLCKPFLKESWEPSHESRPQFSGANLAEVLMNYSSNHEADERDVGIRKVMMIDPEEHINTSVIFKRALELIGGDGHISNHQIYQIITAETKSRKKQVNKLVQKIEDTNKYQINFSETKTSKKSKVEDKSNAELRTKLLHGKLKEHFTENKSEHCQKGKKMKPSSRELQQSF
ncbi:hypothetical protein DNTS_014210, partial [Danionella cerebrum]